MKSIIDELGDDYEIIDWIGSAEDYPAEAQKAIEILYKRYSKPLFKVLRKLLGKRGLNEDDVVDLVQDTFFKIYSKRKTCKRGKATTDKSFLYWLVTIAKNIYRDRPMESERPFSDLSTDNENEGDTSILDNRIGFDPNAEEYAFANEEIVKNYVQDLPDRDREVLIAYFDYYQPGKKTPPEVMAELAERFDTTTDYIRTLRNRLKAKIKKDLENKVLVVSKKIKK